MIKHKIKKILIKSAKENILLDKAIDQILSVIEKDINKKLQKFLLGLEKDAQKHQKVYDEKDIRKLMEGFWNTIWQKCLK